MPRVAIYARVSTQDQHLDPQLAPLRAYAERRGAEAVPFTDKASGARARRPGLDALLDACRRREVEAVVIVKLDRLARSVRHLCEVVAELDSLGIALVALDQAIDTRSASGRLLIHTLGAVAEFERELVVERTKGSRKNKSRFSGRSDGVVPPGQGVASGEGEVTHLGIRDLHALLVASTNEMCSDAEPGGGRGRSCVLEDRLQAVEGASSPVLAELAEEAVLDGVPLGGPGREVGDGDG